MRGVGVKPVKPVVPSFDENLLIFGCIEEWPSYDGSRALSSKMRFFTKTESSYSIVHYQHLRGYASSSVYMKFSYKFVGIPCTGRYRYFRYGLSCSKKTKYF